jgi:hypothetical protein
MMANKKHSSEDQTPGVNLIIIGKLRSHFFSKVLVKMVVIAIGASLVLPACKSHKLCEAYSDSRSLKNNTTGSVSSINHTTGVHTNHQ